MGKVKQLFQDLELPPPDQHTEIALMSQASQWLERLPTTDWLGRLPTYRCPECSQLTIFKRGHPDCVDKAEVANDC